MTAHSNRMEQEMRTARDTIQSIWIAIVLAFVLRAFVIEAFVIPTGSMAPRLMGQHFDLQCPSCGYNFAFGLRSASDQPTARNTEAVSDARCPNCGQGINKPSQFINGGDRVLVLKYLYHLRQPQRWDVVVFKNPQDNRQNYIKRLIGLPGEAIEIIHGDIWAKQTARGKEAPFEIQRKSDRAQEAMWQVVYDNDYPPDRPQWSSTTSGVTSPPAWISPQAAVWNLETDQGRIFDFKGSDKTARLRFQADGFFFRPHYGYNRAFDESFREDEDVCTDLKLSFVWLPQAGDSAVGLKLTSFDNSFDAEVTASGTATIRYKTGQGNNIQQVKLPSLEVGRGYEVALAHADRQVTLWVDGKVALRSGPKEYSETYDGVKVRLEKPVPVPEVWISARGGKSQIRHTKLMRDVYYTSPYLAGYDSRVPPELFKYARSLNIRGNAPGWGTRGHPITLRGDSGDLDEFFVLGDNSPASLDSRMWTQAAPSLRLRDERTGEPIYQLGTVPRYNMIGKAMFVYWPAGFRVGTNLPIVPNVGSMRLIR